MNPFIRPTPPPIGRKQPATAPLVSIADHSAGTGGARSARLPMRVLHPLSLPAYPQAVCIYENLCGLVSMHPVHFRS